MLIKLADTAVAMGQPRVYRDFPLPDYQIMASLENIFDNFFDSETEKRPAAKILIAKRALLIMTMDGLKKIRVKYPPAICRDLVGFLDTDGEPIKHDSFDAPRLTSLAFIIWQRHQRRLEEIR